MLNAVQMYMYRYWNWIDIIDRDYIAMRKNQESSGTKHNVSLLA